MKKIAFALMLLALSVGVAGAAETASLLSLKRVSIAAGLSHRWGADRTNQYVTGLYGAYNVTPHLSLTGSVAYLHVSEKLEKQVGIRIRLWRGSAQ